MEKKKQSSIDWLVEAIMKYDKSFKEFYGAEIEQAKAMHKYEILETFEKGYTCGYRDNGDGGIDYYNETFGGQDNVLGVAINEAEEALSLFAVSGRSEQSSLIHHCGNELTEKEIFHDHCLKCSEYISED